LGKGTFRWKFSVMAVRSTGKEGIHKKAATRNRKQRGRSERENPLLDLG